jgi:2-polyprenyl-6-methoxyphenol hydroxylase-like FAD-dependent oxidoreductase
MEADVVIVGGGPAGAVLALQLAKRGVSVVLLEAAAHYKRSFRGESLQPDTVAILHELGIAGRLAEHGYAETHQMEVIDGGRTVLRVDYSSKPYRHKYIMDAPQPVLLEALLEQLARYSNCLVMRGATARGLLEEGGRVRGVIYRSRSREESLRCRWLIGADGRYSRMRELSGLAYRKIPMQRDFLWFKLPVPAGWSASTSRIILSGADHLVLLPTFPNLFRAGVNIPKGRLAAVRKEGIETFYGLIGRIYPDLHEHVRNHVVDWSDVHPLEIFTLTMKSWWREGMLLIGDAAHTVTPMLGQGVNLAIEDAVILAPMLAEALRTDQADDEVFAGFQAERRADVDFVVRLQMRQERLLCARSAFLQRLRRLNYAVINRSGVMQRRLLDRLAYKRQRLAASA